MKIGFIGAGKVGKGFGTYLCQKGFDISGYVDTDSKASKSAAINAGGVLFENVDDLIKASDIIFITTPDDLISEVCNTLTKSTSFCKRLIIGHMSGAADCSALNTAEIKGAEVFSLHPLQAFADPEKVVKQLKNTYFGLETNTVMSSTLKSFIDMLGNPYFKLESSQKANYHMAAVIVSNYLTTLIDFGLNIFEKAGIDRDQGFTALKPLIQGALQNIEDQGTQKALTGPIARGDKTTILKHLKTFEENDVNSGFYRFMALETLKLAGKEKLKNGDEINVIQRMLEE